MKNPWRFQVWAFQQTTGNPVRKAVLQALAMMADAESGRCEAKVSTLAAGVEVSERSVQMHLAALEKDGLIARRRQYRRDGSQRGSEYLLLASWVVEWPDGEGVNVVRGVNEDAPGGEATFTGGVNDGSGQERPLRNDHSGTTDSQPSSAGARELDVPDDIRHDAEALLQAKRKVGGRLVTEREMWIAAAALAEFNRQAQSDYGLGAWLTPIVMRVRERPRADAATHVRLVQSAWRVKWWQRNRSRRRAQPTVVYGEKAFERTWQDAKDEAAGREIVIERRLKDQVAADGRTWDEWTPNEQAVARERWSLGDFPDDVPQNGSGPAPVPWGDGPLTAENF